MRSRAVLVVVTIVVIPSIFGCVNQRLNVVEPEKVNAKNDVDWVLKSKPKAGGSVGKGNSNP